MKIAKTNENIPRAISFLLLRKYKKGRIITPKLNARSVNLASRFQSNVYSFWLAKYSVVSLTYHNLISPVLFCLIKRPVRSLNQIFDRMVVGSEFGDSGAYRN